MQGSSLKSSLIEYKSSFLLLSNTDRLQQVDDYVRGCTWQLKSVKTIFRVNKLDNGDTNLECFNRSTQNNGLWQPIPVRYCTRKKKDACLCWILHGGIIKDEECMFRVCLYGGWSLSCLVIAAFPFDILCIVISRESLCQLSSGLWQFKCCSRSPTLDVVSLSVGDEPFSPALGHLTPELTDFSFIVRVPDSTRDIQWWSNAKCIGLFLYLSRDELMFMFWHRKPSILLAFVKTLFTMLFHFKSCLIVRNKSTRRGAQLVPIGILRV